MDIKTKRRYKKIGIALSVLLFVAFISSITFTSAFFAEKDDINTAVKLDVGALFGKLHPSQNPSGEWGTTNNPYLINTLSHLHNLYIFQNSKDIRAINESTVFQVSTEYNTPWYVGGESVDALEKISSIGSEDFPFISVLRGVTTDLEAEFIVLPGGEISNTSVIGNIKIEAYPGQVDIGLFGNVGKPSESGTVGRIQDLLLYNVQVKTDSIGILDKVGKLNNLVHDDYFTHETQHETNHIGILAGHAENTEIYNISVYYEQNSTSNTAIIDAFDIDIAGAAKYTTAGGILGYYKNLVVEGAEFPVNSDGFIGGDGGMTVGFGLGIMYSQDIWSFMEKKYFENSPTNTEYGMKDTFGEDFYGSGYATQEYFQIGVFTFAHSSESRLKDRISKLWVQPNSNNWIVSTSSNYSYEAVDTGLPSKEYVCTQVVYQGTGQNNNNPTTGSDITNGTLNVNGTNRTNVHYVSAYPTNSSSPNYRFMVVIESDGKEYALVKYGALAVAQQIDTNNFIIPENQLNYYTFQVNNQREENNDYPPYNSAAYRYYNPGYLVVSNNSQGSSDNARRIPQYVTYGVVDPPTGTGRKTESDRPLRIYDTVSFMATSATNYIEGVYFIRNGTGANTTFVMQRQGLVSSGSLLSNYLRFTETSGFINGSSSTATPVKIYAVRTTENSSNPSESPSVNEYKKIINTPAPGETKEFDMSKNVLFYTGEANASTAQERYSYEMRSIESLKWSDNNGEPIIEVDTVMKMADPTSYYYLNSVFWGVLNNIPAPQEMPTPFDIITVPLASIGFTVQGHGIRNGQNQKAKVYVIVANDPHQYVNQAITISYFNYNTSPSNPSQGQLPNSISYTGTRQVFDTFLLPPVPGSTADTTQNIWVTDEGLSYTAYTNMSTVLIAYEFEVDVVRYSRTYYLEASMGSANFVYLSAERTASGDTNPDHTNDAMLGLTNGIDYVALSQTVSDMVVTVNHEDYIKSQIVPYFGLTANPENRKGDDATKDALKVLMAQNFVYNIFRYYNSEIAFHEIVITVAVKNEPPIVTEAQLVAIMSNMNFNFVEWSYLDWDNYRRIYADAVNININNLAVDWTKLKHLYE